MGVADLPRTAGRFQTGQVADFTEIRKGETLKPINTG
jgi:hypothetical protein